MTFQGALSNFIFEFACGGAIRHLADQGYTSRQIAERLSYPVSYERVREAVTEYYLAEGILLRLEPAQGGAQPKYIYVQEHGEYGKTSFRRVLVDEGGGASEGEWTKRSVTAGELLDRLKRYGGRADTGKAYMSCDFGGMNGSLEELEGLNSRQREYLEGIRWDRRRMYHLLYGRMLEIAIRLCETGCFQGSVYFERTREQLECEADAFMNARGLNCRV